MPKPRQLQTPQPKRLAYKKVAFIREYLVDFCGAAAARRAGYSERTAKQTANKLLKQPLVLNAVIEGQRALKQKVQVEAEVVLRELGCVAFSNMADFVTWGPHGSELRASSELSEAQQRAVMEVNEHRTETTTKDGAVVITSQVRFKLHDKIKALAELAKRLRLFEDAEEDAANPLAILMEQIARSPHGSTIGLLESRRVQREHQESDMASQ